MHWRQSDTHQRSSSKHDSETGKKVDDEMQHMRQSIARQLDRRGASDIMNCCERDATRGRGSRRNFGKSVDCKSPSSHSSQEILSEALVGARQLESSLVPGAVDLNRSIGEWSSCEQPHPQISSEQTALVQIQENAPSIAAMSGSWDRLYCVAEGLGKPCFCSCRMHTVNFAAHQR